MPEETLNEYGEPWRLETDEQGFALTIDRDGKLRMADCDDCQNFHTSKVDRDRIIACVNFCAGLSNEVLTRKAPMKVWIASGYGDI